MLRVINVDNSHVHRTTKARLQRHYHELLTCKKLGMTRPFCSLIKRNKTIEGQGKSLAGVDAAVAAAVVDGGVAVVVAVVAVAAAVGAADDSTSVVA
jgi:hypothetical protein